MIICTIPLPRWAPCRVIWDVFFSVCQAHQKVVSDGKKWRRDAKFPHKFEPLHILDGIDYSRTFSLAFFSTSYCCLVKCTFLPKKFAGGNCGSLGLKFRLHLLSTSSPRRPNFFRTFAPLISAHSSWDQNTENRPFSAREQSPRPR